MFNINREKERKREQMMRQLRKENPGINKLMIKKIWRAEKKEKELEKWCENLLMSKFMDEKNQQIFTAFQNKIIPDQMMVFQEVSHYINHSLENKELYYIRKNREKGNLPMNRKNFEKIRQEAQGLKLGGLERIGIYYKKKRKIIDIASTLQNITDKSFLSVCYSLNPGLEISRTFLDSNGNTHNVVKELRSIFIEKNILQKIVERIAKQYHFIYNLSIMMRNPRYPYFASYYEEEMRKDRLVMTAIPENIIDTYPYARKIRRHFILHVGGPNTGKTYDALKEMSQAPTGIYMAPLRLLAFEVQEKLCMDQIPCSLRTGEEEDIISDSQHESCTIEKLRCDKYYDVAVIDEAQMIADQERGWAWTQAILGAYAPKIHICMSEDAQWIVCHLIELCGDSFEIVRHKRETELVFEDEIFHYPQDVRAHDALIVFSREKVIRIATELEKLGIATSMIYGALPSNVRKYEMERFLRGETKVVVSTDAIGMGLNLPIERIVFLETLKFDGIKKRPLLSTEVKQIAGRAGRKGLYETGYVASVEYKDELAKKMEARLINIKKAKVGFPQLLVELDLPLTDIIQRWMKIPDDGNLEKASMDKEICLCRYMERYFKFEKDKMMGFATIPFDEQKNDMFDYWCYLLECYEMDDGDIDIPMPEECRNLEEMENTYRKYDLVYSFAKVIENEYLQNLVDEYKIQLSENIRHLVAKKEG